MEQTNPRICFFTGHRSLEPTEVGAILDILRKTLEKLVADGITRFRSGGALGFDTLAALAVLDLRATYPHIQLELCLPCRDQMRVWDPQNQQIYQSLLARADRVVCLHETYVQGCMQERNRYLVRDSEIGVAFCTSDRGGSAYTVAYAKKQGVPVINLARLL